MSISQLGSSQVRKALNVGTYTISGVATGLAWGSAGGLYSATLTVPSCLPTSVITATVQSGTEADVLNCWLAKAVPQTGSIDFYLAGNPSVPAQFGVSWHISSASS
jgi:hypothetical protein